MILLLVTTPQTTLAASPGFASDTQAYISPVDLCAIATGVPPVAYCAHSSKLKLRYQSLTVPSHFPVLLILSLAADLHAPFNATDERSKQ